MPYFHYHLAVVRTHDGPRLVEKFSRDDFIDIDEVDLYEGRGRVLEILMSNEGLSEIRDEVTITSFTRLTV